jgi:hypothetical protein
MSSKKDFFAYCKKFIPEPDFKKLMRNLKKYQNSPQYDDFFVEIIIGLYLRQLGLNAKPGIEIQNLTPDWVIFDDNQKIIGIVEVAHLHIDYQNNQEINNQVEEKKGDEPFIISYWMDGYVDNLIRLIKKISKKATQYKHLSIQENIPLVIATYINAYLTFFDDEIEGLLYNRDKNFYLDFDFVDGVVIIHEVEKFIFDIKYWGNPNKSNKFNIPKNYKLMPR